MRWAQNERGSDHSLNRDHYRITKYLHSEQTWETLSFQPFQMSAKYYSCMSVLEKVAWTYSAISIYVLSITKDWLFSKKAVIYIICYRDTCNESSTESWTNSWWTRWWLDLTCSWHKQMHQINFKIKDMNWDKNLTRHDISRLKGRKRTIITYSSGGWMRRGRCHDMETQKLRR